MQEKIYTIPVNDAFDKGCDCPICEVFSLLEKNEIEIIVGASMMEPDIRQQTNHQGFCFAHFEQMYNMQKRLPLALILDSHMDEIKNNLFGKKPFSKPTDYMKKLEENCYICNRINNYLDKIYGTIFHLYSKEKAFREKLEKQRFFCLPHYKELILRGQKSLSKKEFEDFYHTIETIEKNYMNTLSEDVKWFCKKFDYRFQEDDWKNSKDAIERTIYTLTSTKL